MKKVLLAAVLLGVFTIAKAQDEEEDAPKEHKFKKENLFVGGNLNASFFNGTTALGISPYFGYSITNWLDVAPSLNFSYVSSRDYYSYGDKLRQTIVGPGAFVRVFPIPFLFAQVQYEHNFIRYKYFPPNNTGTSINHYDANSLLLGAGFASGRDKWTKTYFYLSLSFDVLQQQYSPYVDNLGRTIPVVNAGFNVALFQGDGGSGRRERRGGRYGRRY